jgi:thioredoxin-dependent peroxiredoxin
MKKHVIISAVAAVLALGSVGVMLAAPADAALAQGASAPDFTAEGALGGQPFSFHLAEALKTGPVVVYFFPAAFTPGCTAETKLFADKADEFAAAGATLIGVTRGNVEQLAKFSTEACRSKFPVAAISKQTMKAYKASMTFSPGWTDRTSYVIAQDGTIVLTYSSGKPDGHVTKTLDAVKALAGRG